MAGIQAPRASSPRHLLPGSEAVSRDNTACSRSCPSSSTRTCKRSPGTTGRGHPARGACPSKRSYTVPSRMCRCWWKPSGPPARRAARSCWCMAWRVRPTRATCTVWPACAVAAGYAVHRLNLRTCGGTEHLARDGLSWRPHRRSAGRVARACQPRAARRSGWWVFLWAATSWPNWRANWAKTARPLLAGVVAASAAIDLEACANRIGQPENRLYESRFLHLMRARARAVWRSTRAPNCAASAQSSKWTIALPRHTSDSAAPYIITTPNRPTSFWSASACPLCLSPRKTIRSSRFAFTITRLSAKTPACNCWPREHGGHLGFLAKRPSPPVAGSRHNGMDNGIRNKASEPLVWKLNAN